MDPPSSIFNMQPRPIMKIKTEKKTGKQNGLKINLLFFLISGFAKSETNKEMKKGRRAHIPTEHVMTRKYN